MTRVLDHIRLTPILIFCATLLFGVKVAHVYKGVTIVAGVSRAQAEGGPAQTPAEAAAKPGEAPPPSPSPTPINVGPTGAELEVLQSLAARRDQLDQRAAEMDMREKLLRAAEDRVAGKINELKKIEGSIKALIEQQDAKKEEELRSLVKVYEAMKPKEAAAIFNALDMPVLIAMISRMKEAKIAPILAIMDAKKANDLTVNLATRKTLPDGPPDGLGDGGAGGSKPVPQVETPAKAAAQTNSAPQPAAAPAQPALRPPGMLQPLPGGAPKGGGAG